MFDLTSPKESSSKNEKEHVYGNQVFPLVSLSLFLSEKKEGQVLVYCMFWHNTTRVKVSMQAAYKYNM